MPTNALTQEIKVAVEKLIERGKIQKLYEVDHHFEQASGWFSDILNDRKKIEPHLRQIVRFVWSKDEDVALEMINEIVGLELTTYRRALGEIVSKLQNGMSDE